MVGPILGSRQLVAERLVLVEAQRNFDYLRVLAVDRPSALALVEPLARAAKNSLDFGNRYGPFGPFALLASSSPSCLRSIRTLAHV